jgi:hypothetical protein
MAGSKPQSKDQDVTREDRETLTSGIFSTLAGYALKHRWMTVIVYGFLALCGLILSFTKLEIDTVPVKYTLNYQNRRLCWVLSLHETT